MTKFKKCDLCSWRTAKKTVIVYYHHLEDKLGDWKTEYTDVRTGKLRVAVKKKKDKKHLCLLCYLDVQANQFKIRLKHRIDEFIPAERIEKI